METNQSKTTRHDRRAGTCTRCGKNFTECYSASSCDENLKVVFTDLDPINDPANQDTDETTFACACGDDACIGHNDDKDNIRIGRAWYAADCAMANNHPWVVEGREQQARDDERGGK